MQLNDKVVTTSAEDHLQQQAELLACKKLYSKAVRKAEGKVKRSEDQAPQEKPVTKLIELRGTEKQYLALLKWVERHGVAVEEKVENTNTPNKVLPLPEPQRAIDPDQQLAA